VHKSFSHIESGSLLVEPFVPVESNCVLFVKHSSISSSSIVDSDSVFLSISTSSDFPNDWSVFGGVICIGSLVSEEIIGMVISSKFVAMSESHSLDGSLMNCANFVSLSGMVVQSLLGEDWTLDASSDFSELMRSSSLTDLDSLVNKFTTEESAVSSVFPHIPDSRFSSSDFASWKSLSSEGGWESPFLKHVEWSANLWASWWSWVDFNGFSIFDPFVSLESEPHVFLIFEDPSVVMPESLIPGPSLGSESVLGWSPVVPLVIIPSEPDFVILVPFPDD